MPVTELSKDAGKDELQATLAVGHPGEGGVLGFVVKYSLQWEEG